MCVRDIWMRICFTEGLPFNLLHHLFIINYLTKYLIACWLTLFCLAGNMKTRWSKLVMLNSQQSEEKWRKKVVLHHREPRCWQAVLAESVVVLEVYRPCLNARRTCLQTARSTNLAALAGKKGQLCLHLRYLPLAWYISTGPRRPANQVYSGSGSQLLGFTQTLITIDTPSSYFEIISHKNMMRSVTCRERERQRDTVLYTQGTVFASLVQFYWVLN